MTNVAPRLESVGSRLDRDWPAIGGSPGKVILYNPRVSFRIWLRTDRAFWPVPVQPTRMFGVREMETTSNECFLELSSYRSPFARVVFSHNCNVSRAFEWNAAFRRMLWLKMAVIFFEGSVTEPRRTFVTDLVTDLCNKTSWLVTHLSLHTLVTHPRYTPQMNNQ